MRRVLLLLLLSGPVQATETCEVINGMILDLHQVAITSYTRADFISRVDDLVAQAVADWPGGFSYDLVDDIYLVAQDVYDHRREYSGLQMKIKFNQDCQERR